MTHAERSHTKRRLAERYGLDVSSDEIFQMAKAIAHGQATLIAHQSRHVDHWQLVYRGQSLRLVFDRQRRSIITALPPLVLLDDLDQLTRLGFAPGIHAVDQAQLPLGLLAPR